jgi:hypothetical protein
MIIFRKSWFKHRTNLTFKRNKDFDKGLNLKANHLHFGINSCSLIY